MTREKSAPSLYQIIWREEKGRGSLRTGYQPYWGGKWSAGSIQPLALLKPTFLGGMLTSLSQRYHQLTEKKKVSESARHNRRKNLGGRPDGIASAQKRQRLGDLGLQKQTGVTRRNHHSDGKTNILLKGGSVMKGIPESRGAQEAVHRRGKEPGIKNCHQSGDSFSDAGGLFRSSPGLSALRPA